ncbi:MAG TPA: MarR family transcriptional regulator [Ignavibacteriales bacterium]|nr:MarR family transcriptional regulator [Ignavibacteriales bacterium]HOL81464.1 MarR family transcriptional regulator [Ignavibacteriales bacterium]HOM65362.1 MarR family transcriptional regulator [Ignavibacteriales bacterium]HPD66990.1 MarR family transcriptional regulator [Ignavibacteriales bacterium]HPP33609.1 MarR family transcriptional regulator [Ignavibacteriales bacterium]
MAAKNHEIAQRLSILTCTLQKVTNDLESDFTAKYNLTPSEFHFLTHLHIIKNVNIKSIAQAMNISYGRISHILNALENKGFVKRDFNKKDKRNIVISLTNKAKDMIEKAHAQYMDMHGEILKNFDAKKSETLVNTLEEYLNSVKSFMQK